MKGKGGGAIVFLFALVAFWLIARRRRRARARDSLIRSSAAWEYAAPATRERPDDTTGRVAEEAEGSADATRRPAIPGRRMMRLGSIASFPVLGVGLAMTFFVQGRVADLLNLWRLDSVLATCLLMFGVVYFWITAKTGRRVRRRFARALAVASAVAGLVIALELPPIVFPFEVRLGFVLLQALASPLLVFGAFRYSASHAFVPDPPSDPVPSRTGSMISAETHTTVRVRAVAFAVAAGVHAVATLLAGSPLIDRLLGGVTSPAAATTGGVSENASE